MGSKVWRKRKEEGIRVPRLISVLRYLEAWRSHRCIIPTLLEVILQCSQTYMRVDHTSSSYLTYQHHTPCSLSSVLFTTLTHLLLLHSPVFPLLPYLTASSQSLLSTPFL